MKIILIDFWRVYKFVDRINKAINVWQNQESGCSLSSEAAKYEWEWLQQVPATFHSSNFDEPMS